MGSFNSLPACFTHPISILAGSDTTRKHLKTALFAFVGCFPVMLGNWPSFDPANFSQVRPADPSSPSRMTPATYCPTHDRCVPPPNQVIASEAKNILMRNLYKRAEDKQRPKRAASENLPGQGSKNPRISGSSL